MLRARRMLAVLAIAGASVGTSLFLSGEAMAATPQAASVNCDYALYSTYKGGPPTGGSVACPTSSRYRVVIVCHDGINGVNYTVYGPYKTSGATSRANCAAPQRQTVTKIYSQ